MRDTINLVSKVKTLFWCHYGKITWTTIFTFIILSLVLFVHSKYFYRMFTLIECLPCSFIQEVLPPLLAFFQTMNLNCFFKKWPVYVFRVQVRCWRPEVFLGIWFFFSTAFVSSICSSYLKSFSRFSALSQWSSCLFLCQYHSIWLLKGYKKKNLKTRWLFPLFFLFFCLPSFLPSSLFLWDSLTL